MKKWYKWPKGFYEANYKPWYSILRAFGFYPLMLLTFGLFYLSIVLMSGLSGAEDTRKDIF